MKKKDISYYFIVMASIIIVFSGIKSASEIIVPFLLSLFLAIILLPSYNFFNKKGLPNIISLLLVIGTFVLVLLLVAKLIGTSITDFNANIDSYSEKLTEYYVYIVNITSKVGIELSVNELSTIINSKEMMSFATKIMHNMGSMFTNSFVVLLTIIFMLLESSHFKAKIELIGEKNEMISHLDKITSQIKEYMFLKTLISFLTGVTVWISLSIVGTDYAFLWAVVAFLFNFIPNIGSLIAAVPSVLLTLVQFGVIDAIIVSTIYIFINIIIGSIVEPKIMGKGLGISTLVVFLSLIFWGWLLGIVGMLLSIPLTIMLKIILDNNHNARWISILLGTDQRVKAK